MGGPGSGNSYNWRRGSKKSVVEACLSLDANRLTREGILKTGVHLSGTWRWKYRSGRECTIGYEVCTAGPAAPWARLHYSVSGLPVDFRYNLTTTRPRFGGLRWWFLCPLGGRGPVCGRRVGKLYLPAGGLYFGCRRCHDLTYTSCQESGKFRGLYRLLAANTGYDIDTVRQALKLPGKRK
jgi:hypothetical protein